MKYNRLNEEEERIISGQGTEAPFTGVYDNFFRDGVYLCRRCDALLYQSKDKFDAHCGWPSFDDEVPGAVVLSLDPDGSRTEISCANCDAHLGHVFFGERLTGKDTRHCVNSLSMRFIPQDFAAGEKAEAYLAGGCFWCLEAVYENIKGVIDVVSGYAGGQADTPTYEKVSGGKTGHAETVKVTYDPSVLPYQKILEIFFTIHDPSTLNRQGNDIGEQYRSAVYYKTWRQRQEAAVLIAGLDAKGLYGGLIVTEIKPLIRFFEAEEEHQDYYRKNPEQAYCQAVINPKLSKLRSEWADYLAAPQSE